MVKHAELKQLELKRVPASVDRVGGVGSLLSGLACAYIGWGDRALHSSIWKVWAFFCVLLICNGIAMLIHAAHTQRLSK